MSSYFEFNSLLSSSQQGFRRGKSTTLEVLNMIDHSLEAFERK